MRLFGFFLVFVLLAAGVVALMGAALPEEHTSSLTVIVPAGQEQVFTMISHVQDYPHWRTGVNRVDLLPEVNGQFHWQENTSMGNIPQVLTVNEPLSRRVVTIDPGLGFGGTWTFELVPQGSQTQLTITENADVTNVFYRFADQYIFGQSSTIEQYENDLVKAVQ